MNSQFMSSDFDSLVLSKMSASTELAHIPHFHIPQPQTQSVNTAAAAAADHNITIPCKRKNWPHAKCYNFRAKKPKTQNQNHKVSPPAPAPAPGYIHVRARRGQATDSHSLAERIRREKISQRMKVLQTLVPGCHKVTGKALMLDEIINYVQSLQNQVEFLSMKLASVNPILYDFGMDNPEVFIGRPDSEPEILNGNGVVANSEEAELAYNMANSEEAELAYNMANSEEAELAYNMANSEEAELAYNMAHPQQAELAYNMAPCNDTFQTRGSFIPLDMIVSPSPFLLEHAGNNTTSLLHLS